MPEAQLLWAHVPFFCAYVLFLFDALYSTLRAFTVGGVSYVEPTTLSTASQPPTTPAPTQAPNISFLDDDHSSSNQGSPDSVLSRARAETEMTGSASDTSQSELRRARQPAGHQYQSAATHVHVASPPPYRGIVGVEGSINHSERQPLLRPQPHPAASAPGQVDGTANRQQQTSGVARKAPMRTTAKLGHVMLSLLLLVRCGYHVIATMKPAVSFDLLNEDSPASPCVGSLLQNIAVYVQALLFIWLSHSMVVSRIPAPIKGISCDGDQASAAGHRLQARLSVLAVIVLFVIVSIPDIVSISTSSSVASNTNSSITLLAYGCCLFIQLLLTYHVASCTQATRGLRGSDKDLNLLFIIFSFGSLLHQLVIVTVISFSSTGDIPSLVCNYKNPSAASLILTLICPLIEVVLVTLPGVLSLRVMSSAWINSDQSVKSQVSRDQCSWRSRAHNLLEIKLAIFGSVASLITAIAFAFIQSDAYASPLEWFDNSLYWLFVFSMIFGYLGTLLALAIFLDFLRLPDGLDMLFHFVGGLCARPVDEAARLMAQQCRKVLVYALVIASLTHMTLQIFMPVRADGDVTCWNCSSSDMSPMSMPTVVSGGVSTLMKSPAAFSGYGMFLGVIILLLAVHHDANPPRKHIAPRASNSGNFDTTWGAGLFMFLVSLMLHGSQHYYLQVNINGIIVACTIIFAVMSCAVYKAINGFVLEKHRVQLRVPRPYSDDNPPLVIRVPADSTLWRSQHRNRSLPAGTLLVRCGEGQVQHIPPAIVPCCCEQLISSELDDVLDPLFDSIARNVRERRLPYIPADVSEKIRILREHTTRAKAKSQELLNVYSAAFGEENNVEHLLELCEHAGVVGASLKRQPADQLPGTEHQQNLVVAREYAESFLATLLRLRDALIAPSVEETTARTRKVDFTCELHVCPALSFNARSMVYANDLEHQPPETIHFTGPMSNPISRALARMLDDCAKITPVDQPEELLIVLYAHNHGAAIMISALQALFSALESNDDLGRTMRSRLRRVSISFLFSMTDTQYADHVASLVANRLSLFYYRFARCIEAESIFDSANCHINVQGIFAIAPANTAPMYGSPVSPRLSGFLGREGFSQVLMESGPGAHLSRFPHLGKGLPTGSDRSNSVRPASPEATPTRGTSPQAMPGMRTQPSQLDLTFRVKKQTLSSLSSLDSVAQGFQRQWTSAEQPNHAIDEGVSRLFLCSAPLAHIQSEVFPASLPSRTTESWHVVVDTLA